MAGGRNPDIRVPKSHHGLFPDVDTAVQHYEMLTSVPPQVPAPADGA